MGCKSALQRYGALGLGVVVVATGTAFTAAPAFAAAGDPVAVTITDPAANSAFALVDDGHDGAGAKSFHLGADLGGDTSNVAGVKFYATKDGGTQTYIGSDNSAPYSVEWTPADAGHYTIEADAIGSTASNTQGVTVTSTGSAAHINLSDGDRIGAFAGKIPVSGTASADSLGLTVAGAPVSYPDATHLRNWTVLAPVTSSASADTTNTIDVSSVANPGDPAATPPVPATPAASLEHKTVSVYQQVLTHLTVTAPSAQVPTNTDATFKVSATDQFGKPIAGLTFTASSPNGGTAAGNYVATDATGVGSFTGQGPAAGSYTFNVVSTNAGGGAKELTGSASLTAYAAKLTSVAINSAKDQFLSGGYTAAGAPVTVSLLDQNQNVIPSATNVNGFYRVTRTLAGGTATVIQDWAALSTFANGKSANMNTHAVGASDEGQDVYEFYIEGDGAAGRSSGDLQVSKTVKFSPVKFGFDIANGASSAKYQQQNGTTKTYDLSYSQAGQPVAGRKVTVTLPTGNAAGAIFPDAQPANVARVSSTTVTATTDAAGKAHVTVTSPGGNDAGPVSLLASDPGDANFSAQSSTLSIYFRKDSVALDHLDVSAVQGYVAPAAGLNGLPGTVEQKTVVLMDKAGNALYNVPATMSLDHGYFTSQTTTGNYKDFDFGTVKDGDAVQGPASHGATLSSLNSGDTGAISGYFSIGKDAGFANGAVNVKGTVSSLGASATDVVGSFNNNGAVNTGDFSLALDNSRLTVSRGYDLDGDKAADAGSAPESRSVSPVFTDAFGNPVAAGETAAISVDNGKITDPGVGAVPATSDNSVAPSEKDALTMAADGSQNVSGTATTTPWVFKVDSTTGAITVVPATTNKVQTAKLGPLDWYTQQVPADGITFDQVAKSVLNVGKTDVVSVTAKDQKDNPLVGLHVNWTQTGIGADKSNQSDVTTNSAGKATWVVVGTSAGTATTTGVVTDDLGNVLASDSKQTRFWSGKTVITSAPASRTGAGAVVLRGTARPGAKVELSRSFDGGRSFTLVQPTVADDNGTFATTAYMARNTLFQVKVDGSEIGRKAVAMVSAPALSLSSTLKGYVNANIAGNPGMAGQKVAIYVLDAKGAKHYVASATADSKGVAHFKIRTTSRHAYKFAAYAYGNSAVNGAWSATKGITSK